MSNNNNSNNINNDKIQQQGGSDMLCQNIMMWSFIWILISHVQSSKGFTVYSFVLKRLQFLLCTRERASKKEWKIWWAKIRAILSKLNFEAHAKEKRWNDYIRGAITVGKLPKIMWCDYHGVSSFWFFIWLNVDCFLLIIHVIYK